MIQARELMLVEAALSHARALLQCAEHGDEVAQRKRFACEDFSFGLDGVTGLLIGRAGFQAARAQRQNAVALFSEFLLDDGVHGENVHEPAACFCQMGLQL